ncbi:hypothetical protein N035_005035 [Klebsiella pneumoniae EGD-HP19-C]|nr:hypothetical protein N035_005035 [Klebsiella pneumoniae EGD-HP19-C]
MAAVGLRRCTRSQVAILCGIVTSAPMMLVIVNSGGINAA